MKTAVIIVAGGNGVRMGGSVPKQFLLLAGKPLLMHTIERFSRTLPDAEPIVVLPPDQLAYWADLCREYAFGVGHTVVAGGETRFHSVKNGLEKLSGCDYIGVHDGVRPMITNELTERVLDAARNFGAAIPAVPVSDSLREIFREENPDAPNWVGNKSADPPIARSQPVDRGRFVAVQTPQFFRAQVLVDAYRQAYRPEFTDDASVVEASGHPVVLVPGDPANLKVTTPADLATAEALLKKGGS